MSEVSEALSRFEFPEKLGRFARRFETFEEVWMECHRADWMFWLLEAFGRGSRKGLRLFICTCARRWWVFMPDVRSRRAVDLGERYAAGDATQGAVEFIRQGAVKAAEEAAVLNKPIMARASRMAVLALEPDVLAAAKEASTLATAAGHAIHETESEEKEMAILQEHAQILRELMGNPFSPAPAEGAVGS
ncbi:MAG: hypothetical protein ACR2IE_20055 [Candidatus Sumerlaeaceae bacterium]